jgi:hypothetical protein
MITRRYDAVSLFSFRKSRMISEIGSLFVTAKAAVPSRTVSMLKPTLIPIRVRASDFGVFLHLEDDQRLNQAPPE